jgi:hypothetical protein
MPLGTLTVMPRTTDDEGANCMGAVAYSLDGLFIPTTSGDGSLYPWGVKTLEHGRAIRKDDQLVSALARRTGHAWPPASPQTATETDTRRE